MSGKKLPDNWEGDTRFDGPEHWGMDPRWKGLFPKSVMRAGDSSGRNNKLVRRSVSAESYSDDDTVTRDTDDGDDDALTSDKTMATVDISKEYDDEDDDGLDGSGGGSSTGVLSSEGDGLDATNARVAAAFRTRKTETAPADDLCDDLDWHVLSSRRPRKDAKSTENTSKSKYKEVGKSSGKSEARAVEAEARRWRQGKVRATEPASSSKADRAVHNRAGLGTPLYVSCAPCPSSDEEGEEEFDESEANITGHERSLPLTVLTTPRRRRREDEDDLISDGVPSSTAMLDSRTCSRTKGNGERKGGRGLTAGSGGAASPLSCDGSCSSGSSLGSPTRASRDVAAGGGGRAVEPGEEIDSSVSDSDLSGDFSGPGKKSSGGGGGSSSRASRLGLLSATSPGLRMEGRAAGRRGDLHQHRHHLAGGLAKGSVLREGGRLKKKRQPCDPSSKQSRSGASSPRSSLVAAASRSGSVDGREGGGAIKRSIQTSGKRIRKIVPAKADEQGWITSKVGGGSGGSGGGGGGGGDCGDCGVGGGSGRGENPLGSFRGSRSSIRRNKERRLTQSKLNFTVPDD